MLLFGKKSREAVTWQLPDVFPSTETVMSPAGSHNSGEPQGMYFN